MQITINNKGEDNNKIQQGENCIKNKVWKDNQEAKQTIISIEPTQQSWVASKVVQPTALCL